MRRIRTKWYCLTVVFLEPYCPSTQVLGNFCVDYCVIISSNEYRLFPIACRTLFGATRVSIRTMVSDPIITQKHPLSEDDADSIVSKKQCIEPRIKRKKCAILLAYSGQGYLGLQR